MYKYECVTYNPFLQLIPEDFKLLEFHQSGAVHLRLVQENSMAQKM